jgi:hypothetical protein
MAVMGFLSFLLGCQSKGPYQLKDGVWHFEDVRLQGEPRGKLTPLNGTFAKSADRVYYRDVVVPEADAASFQALSDHYAKDRRAAYYGDTYRDGREYFLVKRSRVRQIAGADATTFRSVEDEYGRDARNWFFEGERFAVEDADSYEILDDGFGRDKVRGYYMRAPVPDSDGRSFAVVDNHYAKDAGRVFHCDLEPALPPIMRATRLPGAVPGTFKSLGSGYAADDSLVFYRGVLVSKEAPTFQVLTMSYAKSASQVFYLGEAVKGADAPSFAVLDSLTETADAADRAATYQQGRRTKR